MPNPFQSEPSPTIIGSAKEFHKGSERRTACYGTYEGDMPDPKFRFNVQMVEHQDDFRMHSHEYSELVVVLAGQAQRTTEAGNQPIQTGDVFVINGNTRHGFESAKGLRLCNVMFDPAQFPNDKRDLDSMMGFHALFELEPRQNETPIPQRKLRLNPQDLVFVTALLTSMQNEIEAAEDGWQTMIRSKFPILVIFLSRRYAQQQKDNTSPLVRMANVMAYIRANYGSAIRMEELAHIAHLSVSQLQRSFKKVYHITPVRFINQVRIHQACELLGDPNRDLTSIALDCGFSSSAFFSTQFKQVMNESPSNYRKRVYTENGTIVR